MFLHLDHISLSWHTCYVLRGRALSICQGRTSQVAVLWCCMWGRGQRGNNAACSALTPLLVTSPITYKQIVLFRCCPGADSQVGGLLYILGPRGSLPQTLLWLVIYVMVCRGHFPVLPAEVCFWSWERGSFHFNFTFTLSRILK